MRRVYPTHIYLYMSRIYIKIITYFELRNYLPPRNPSHCHSRESGNPDFLFIASSEERNESLLSFCPNDASIDLSPNNFRDEIFRFRAIDDRKNYEAYTTYMLNNSKKSQKVNHRFER